ncbi:MAG: PEGA domain-containing protein [Gammaproteobacteria bacterium]|nr:PEGA domain-containing protein [Gammaproteobacteria bacterium]
MRVFLIGMGIALLVALGPGCATITRGTNEAFVIETDPPGAEARLSNGLRCTTPCSLTVKRRGDFVVMIEKEGYETVVSNVTSSVDSGGAAGMAGNVILGGIIGAGVDAGTGAMHSHKPNPLRIELEPVQHEERKDQDDST